MFRVLLKKQIAEVFRSYFYNAKKNKMRSKWEIAGWIAFFVIVMVGMLGGLFTVLSISLCGVLTESGVGWLYFLLMGLLSVFLGAFGSVFNTYSGLYLAKDNDLLLSLPIPVRTIMAARLANVYLMGAMYAATVFLPALIVYWVVAGLTVSRLLCGLLLFLIVTVVVLLLSCLLGWVVARISLRLKNKSFITVLVALVFLGAYYFFYFKASDLIRDLMLNAVLYGAKIKGAAYGLYLFGRIGEGDWRAAAIVTAVIAVLSALIWYGMARSFLGIATASGSTGKVKYVEKTIRQKSVFAAVLGKEFARFTSSANYMLNCGLGILLLPAFGVLLLIKGRELCDVLGQAFARLPDAPAVLLCAMLCMLLTMIDAAAPAVSLEGKSIWLPQSLPVSAKTVLRAKACVQLILSGTTVLFAAVCAVIVLDASALVKLMLVLTALSCAAFLSVSASVVGVKMPLLSWTDEVVPIKQSGAVGIVLFGTAALGIALGALYLLIGYKLGAAVYLLLWTLLFIVGGLLLLRWLDRKGAAAFEAL